MTVKIHIPSSEAPDEPPSEPDRRPTPGPLALSIAASLALAMLGVLTVSVVSGTSMPDSSIPEPFEAEQRDAAVPISGPPEAWTERALPGLGEVLTVGTAANTPIAVVRGWPTTNIWRLDDGAWSLEGTTDLAVESAVVMDDRILLLANQGSRPTVWEWVDGSPTYLFQPTTGSIVGMWSVRGRLLVSVAASVPDLEQTLRSGRRDVLWMESLARDFDKVTLINIESVLAIDRDLGITQVGGRNSDGRAVVGFVHGDIVLATPVPDAPQLSAVTGFAGDGASLVARVSVANGRRGTRDEIRSATGDWALVAEGPDLVGADVIDDVVVGVTNDGSIVRHRLDGIELPVPSSPPWSHGFLGGFAVLGGEPVAFGQSGDGSPMLMGPSVDQADVTLPAGRWERYHSEASDGFHLVHVGSLEFATRDAELFYRAWNADRWRPVDSNGELVVFGTPRILALDWGFVLLPSSGKGAWASVDGATWRRVKGSDVVRMQDAVTNGEIVVGFSHLGALGGPTTNVTVLEPNGELVRVSLPFHLVGPLWADGIGFVATVASPEFGYATSADGVEWTRHDGPDRFDWVVALDGALYVGSGDPVVSGDAPASTPADDGWMYPLGETLVFQSADGGSWIHDGNTWLEAPFGVEEGLPRRPDSIILRGPRAYAMIDHADGPAETYVLELD